MHRKSFIVIPTVILLTLTTYIYVAPAQDYISPNHTLSGAKIVIAGGSAYSPNYSLGSVEIGNITGSTAGSSSYTLDASLGDKKALFDPPIINIINPLDGTISYEGPITMEWTVDGAPFTGQKDIALNLNNLTVMDSNGPHTSCESVEVYGVRMPPGLPD